MSASTVLASAHRPPGTRTRVRRRAGLAWVLVGLAVLTVGATALMVGELSFSAAEVVAALTGHPSAQAQVVVLGWRLPRVLLGVLVGVALGLSGALFQISTRNSLGSPDVLGFTTGASTGAMLVLVGGLAGRMPVAAGALAGGLLTAGALGLLVARTGAQGYRLIVVGIGLTAMLNAFTTLLVLHADERAALSAAIWGAGSLNGVDGAWVRPVALVLLGCWPVVAALAPALRLHDLGDDVAAGLGGRPARVRTFAMLVGVVLAAVATAVAGPIAFVALAAPQIARRAWGSGPVPLAASAAVGALLLTASDLLAQRLLAPTILPTGLVTVCLGGAYLAWVLTLEGRRR